MLVCIASRTFGSAVAFAAQTTAWANSRRLQTLLADAGIAYGHHKELAPTTELRQLQYAEDDRRGVGKRSRIELAPGYVRGYTEMILDRADLSAFAASLPEGELTALMCVERDPEACHRSLIAERLVAEHGARRHSPARVRTWRSISSMQSATRRCLL